MFDIKDCRERGGKDVVLDPDVASDVVCLEVKGEASSEDCVAGDGDV